MDRKFFTIGYEGSSIEDFVATLIHQEVDMLIDVRDVPVSRKPGFSKSALSAVMKANDIGYVHLRGLGDPREGREAARSGRIDEFQAIFEAHMRSDVAQSDFAKAVELVMQSSACLLCFERNPKHCHRTIVADHILAVTDLKRQSLGVKEGLAKETGPIRLPDEQDAA